MAIAMLISSETVRDGCQYVGDVVQIQEDDYVFSETELEKFSFLAINGTRSEVEARLLELLPEKYIAFKWNSDNQWHLQEATAPDYDIDEMDVWQPEGSKRWYELVTSFKFGMNIDSLTPEEKQLLETININHPSVDSFIRKTIKDLAALLGNDAEVTDLRNESI
ncbi:MAG: hypothetical protein ACYSTX_00090 [Planctomycetota bacterium]|jgi:hypothetical protein